MTKLTICLAVAALCAGCAGTATQSPGAGTVKITPLGTHDGEFCLWDRALVMEDPNGTRILYDAGRTVRGPDDPRLGKIDAVLLTHVHFEHLGDAHPATANAGACGKPDISVTDIPSSNTVNIVVGKKARFLLGAEMATFFREKVKAAGGDPAQVQLLRFGAMTSIGDVAIASVPAAHSNGLEPRFIGSDLGKSLQASGLTAYVGEAGGYVVQFTNGLVVYLSGDTGVIAEQDLVVRRLYKANLAVINIGGIFTMGPAEASYVITDMVKPNAVIPSHANEMATKGGKVVPGSRTEQFMKRVGIPTHVPLSGKTMTFDGSGRCVAGC